jgi:hypothetical protein
MQLERINVYFNEVSSAFPLTRQCTHSSPLQL